MTTTVINMKDAAAFFGTEWPKRHRAAALRGLLSAALHGVQTIQTTIIPSRTPSPVDRGIYRAGWRSGPIENGAELWNDDPTAVFVEGGVRAENVKLGAAIIAALTAWVMRKGLVSDSVEAKSMAFAIVRRMQQRGIFNKGSTGLGILKEFNERYAEQYAKEEIERELRQELR